MTRRPTLRLRDLLETEALTGLAGSSGKSSDEARFEARLRHDGIDSAGGH